MSKVYISIMGNEAAKKGTLKALEHARGHIQSVVGKRLGIKHTPVLSFYLEEASGKGLHVSKLIEEISMKSEEAECQS